MPTLNVRASVVAATNNTTWSTTANAIDGAFGALSATYSVWTNTVANAVGYIELGFGSAFAAIPAGSVINSVTVTLRHLESNTSRLLNVQFQPYDGTTALGTLFTATRATAARSDTTTFPVTLAQLQSANFKVRVTATRFNGTQAGTFSIDYIDVTVDYTPPPEAPTVSLAQDKTTAAVTEKVTFTATVTGSPAPTLTWDFGDGLGATLPADSVSEQAYWNTSGTKTVTVTATNASGSQQASKQVTVSVPPAPVAVLAITSTGPYTAGVTPVQVSVAGSAPGLDLLNTAGECTATIDWGDGSADTVLNWDADSAAWIGGQTASHIYATAGPYTITLTVDRTVVGPATVSDTEPVTITVASTPSGQVWNGTSWQYPEIWNGTRWVPGSEVEVFNGTAWVPMGTAGAPVPRLVRSGRGAAAVSVNIDLSGVTAGKKTLLFVTRNNSAASLSCPVGTLLANDTGGPRRTSVWDMTDQTGTVTITADTSSLWCYAVVEVESILAAACGYTNDSTSEAAPVSTTAPAGSGKAVVWWTCNNSADWTTPSGVTMLEAITTQNSEPSWLLGWMNAVPGAYTTPVCDRGKAGTARIETTGLALCG